MPIFSRRPPKVPTAPSATGVFKDLASLLAFAPVAASLGERVQWIEDLIEWVRIPVAPEKNPKGSGQLQGARLRYLLQALEKNPPWQAAFTTLVISVLRETEPLSLFCEIGMGRDGIFADAAERVLRRVLPAPQDEKNLLELVGRIFSEEEDAEWIEGLGATAVSLANLLFSDPAVSEELRLKYRRAMSEALVVISSEAEAIGLSEEVRVRSQVESVTRSAYYRLRLAVTDVLEGRLPAADAAAAFTPLFLACREEINAAFAHLEERGVSVAIVYKLEKLERMLKRMETLLPMLFPIDGRDPAPEAWPPMVANLVRRRLEGSQVWSLVQSNLHMLARKIVERSGASGEHYITTSTREYVSMLLSAAGGGVITAFTAVFKVLVSKASPAPFFEGLFHWINFSGSFLIMQALHFTLATKQPSMTAPALASKLKESNDREEFSLLVARITRSQFAAAVGNIGATIPAAILIDLAWRLLAGHSFLSAEYAAHSVESLHPWKSFTIPFAILTGVLLWVSSIVAGWVENWFVYRRLPEAIGQSVWMPGRAGAISGWVVRNVGPVAGNLSLGFLLAYTTVVTKFFGVALEVRHVTISTATLTLAMMAGPEVSKTDLVMAMVSILLIGLLNFGVSFALALATAAKAREVGRVRLRLLRLALGRKFRQNPAHFFFPPYRPATASSEKN